MNGHVEVDGLLQDKGRGMEMPKDGDGVDGASEGEESDDLELHELAKETTGFVPDESNEGGFEEGQSQPKPGHRARTQSLSSISFAFDMLPLLLSRETVDPAESQREVKHLDLTSGIALVVGLQIGSGVFSSPGILTAECGSVGMALLGSAIPLNGGPQAYLRYSYGPTVSYLFSWTAIVAIKPGSAAIIAIIFGEYLCRIFYHTAFNASSEASVKSIPVIVVKLVAMSAIFAVSLLNAVSLKTGTRAQIALTIAKLAALLAVAIMGVVQLAKGRSSESLRGNVFQGSTGSPGRYALALYSGTWAYSGWDQCCFVAGEMKNVTRDLPRVIHISLAMVMALFIVANISYFIVLPKDLVSQSNTVGLDFGKEMLGPVGGVVFAGVVATSCFGAIHRHIPFPIRDKRCG
ncbi:MAG: hypothetical protein CYPHOPRED_003298 [Cyphobasidiales sp. Tagirdzhanova-0007]|nr:MAG: hypothetical protein CYPHOPRED_003298 [Cyphobasidiales sp. Tagirdzhanova-0007]